jgi:hypothetical protein
MATMQKMSFVLTCLRRGFGRQASKRLPIISPGILKQLRQEKHKTPLQI